MKSSPAPIVITAGEPAGIGPDLVIAVAQRTWPAPLVVIADPDLLQTRAKQLNLPLVISIYDPSKPAVKQSAGHLTVFPVKLTAPATCGKLDPANASYVIETLRIAAQGCLKKQFSAVVTCPVHKGIINQAGIQFQGHTEFFAEFCQVKKPVMLMVADELRVALVTTHLPLNKVAAAITPDNLRQTLLILQKGLQDFFNIKSPRILVAGLNPHAGENGYLGREEIDVIIPVLDELRANGMPITGPLPADTLFLPKNLTQADAVLAMYHDQGLPVLKHIGFDHAVNVTLGLPFIRTSVDHGTALELAGSGKADTGSLTAAMELAIQLGSVNAP